jgi:hypothetical protein
LNGVIGLQAQVLSGCKKNKKVAVLICLRKVFILNFKCRKKAGVKNGVLNAFTRGEGFIPDLRGVFEFLSELASAFSAQRLFSIKTLEVKPSRFSWPFSLVLIKT